MRIHLEMLDYIFFSLCHFLFLFLCAISIDEFVSLSRFRPKSEHAENISVRHHFHSHFVSVGMLPNDKKNIILIKKTHTHSMLLKCDENLCFETLRNQIMKMVSIDA